MRNVPPSLTGLVAIVGCPLGVALLTALPQQWGAPPWVLLPLGVLGAVLGYLASRAVLRRLYMPR